LAISRSIGSTHGCRALQTTGNSRLELAERVLDGILLGIHPTLTRRRTRADRSANLLRQLKDDSLVAVNTGDARLG